MTPTTASPPNGKSGSAGVLQVEGLQIRRTRRGSTHTIVSSIDLSLAEGETIGIVGESGSGKSMTARAITGLLPPTLTACGDVRYRGRSLLGLSERQWRTIRGREIGLILQDPFTMLNPVLRCGRTLDESILHRRTMTRTERRVDVLRRLAEVGIHDESVIDRYPFQLSGGMLQRVAIAAALARDPNVLIADEPSTALDATTQRELLALLKEIQAVRRMSLILITHDLRVAFAMCDRVYVLYAGSLVETAPASALETEPLHPYSHGLLLSEPSADYRVRELVAVPGSVPAADDVAGSCTFAPRCRWARPVCRERTPVLAAVGRDRLSACVRLSEIRSEMSSLRRRAQEEAYVPDVGERPNPLVRINDVRKIFGSAGQSVEAVGGVSLQVGSNESVALVGESGSGKTTIARMLVGLERPTTGEILIDGVNAQAWDRLSSRDKKKLRRTVQIVFQDPYSSLNPMRSIGWTLREAITTHDSRAKNVDGRVAELLQDVGLPASYAKRRPVALSGGERQRVAIARALAVDPKLLICDEPVSALDVSVQAQVLNLFASLRTERGIGYFFITHDLAIVRQIADYVYVMHRGRIVERGHTKQVLEYPEDPYTIKLLGSVPRSEGEWLLAR